MTSPTTSPRVIPQGFQLTLKLTHGGQPAAIVLGATGPGSWTDTQGVEAWRDAAWTALRQIAHTSVVCIGATGRSLSTADALPYEVGAPANQAGFQGGTPTVAAACSLLKWTTSTGGRSGRGRTFVPGLCQEYVVSPGRAYLPAYITTMQGAVNNYLSAMAANGAGLSPAVLSFRRQQAFVITGGSPASIIGMQRRRMR